MTCTRGKSVKGNMTSHVKTGFKRPTYLRVLDRVCTVESRTPTAGSKQLVSKTWRHLLTSNNDYGRCLCLSTVGTPRPASRLTDRQSGAIPATVASEGLDKEARLPKGRVVMKYPEASMPRKVATSVQPQPNCSPSSSTRVQPTKPPI